MELPLDLLVEYATTVHRTSLFIRAVLEEFEKTKRRMKNPTILQKTSSYHYSLLTDSSWPEATDATPELWETFLVPAAHVERDKLPGCSAVPASMSVSPSLKRHS